MKKIFTYLMIFTLVLGSISLINAKKAEAADYINYVNFEIDGSSHYFNSILRDGITYVAIREIAAQLPTTTVGFNSSKNVVTINVKHKNKKRTKNVEVSLNKTKNYVYDKKSKKSYGQYKPLLSNGATYISMNDLAAIFDFKYTWVDQSKTLEITYNGYNYISSDGSQTHFLNHDTALRLLDIYSVAYKADKNYYKQFNKVKKHVVNGLKKLPHPGAGKIASGVDKATGKVSQKMMLDSIHKDYKMINEALKNSSYKGTGIYLKVKSDNSGFEWVKIQ